MFSLYTVLLTLHILFVIAWLGAGITVQVLTAQSGDEPAAGPMLARFGEKWFAAVSGLAAVTGVLLWIDGPYEFGELWILLAVAGWIASSAIGATQLGPNVLRWGQGDTAARDVFVRFARIDLVILVLVVVDMVMKPGL